VLRALAFITVRQEQHQAGEQVPLGFTGHYELINDGLRNIGEVAELRLPQHQHLREIAAVAIFKTQDSGLRKRRIVNTAMCLAFGDMLQRHIFLLVHNVQEH